ncbi:MAG: RidA family protein [Calditerrivibrio sp.]|nr:RidA family protein [Calditerrivibrio sp.]MCA1933116.1 RidA family protein [Calditerrivibrio sp.]MCA1980030.1 RidA family protein [Calditerrivibrio sp.]
MEFISTDNAPKAIGPYSQATRCGNILFVSGQIPIDPKSNMVIEGTIEEMTLQVLNNIKAIVEFSNFKITDIAKVTLFIKDMSHFGVINSIYESFFGDHKPARAVVEVSRLPKDVLIEAECIAIK